VYNDVYLKDDVVLAIQRVLLKLKTLCVEIKQGSLSAEKGKKIIIQPPLQTIYNDRPNNRLERTIHEIIIEHALAAEHMGPKGFILCIESLVEKFKDGSRWLPTQDVCDYIKGNVRVPTVADVKHVLDIYVKPTKFIHDLVFEAVKLAGFTGRIIVEKTPTVTSIELVKGYTFNVRPSWHCDIKLQNPHVLCVDGYIESVSEVHHLLEAAAETKSSVLLFVRGMSDDVRHTLKFNNDRGTLRVLSFEIPLDLDGLNTLNDIATVSCSDVVSSTKGELISSIKFNELTSLEHAIIRKDRVTLINSKAHQRVLIHVSFLREKRKKQNVDDVAKLLDARIKSLSPNHVVIRLPDDKHFVETSQIIDYILRIIRSMNDYGMVEINGKKNLTSTTVAIELQSQNCYKRLIDLGAVITC
jgi:chaperonin GroEL (HSP60 family)